MSWFTRLFQKTGKEPEKPKTRAFVDFEHWYYSLKDEYGIRPDVMAWRAELSAKYTLDDILIFGDFSFSGIRDELPELRNITNSIIETHQQTGHHKKDTMPYRSRLKIGRRLLKTTSY